MTCEFGFMSHDIYYKKGHYHSKVSKKNGPAPGATKITIIYYSNKIPIQQITNSMCPTQWRQ